MNKLSTESKFEAEMKTLGTESLVIDCLNRQLQGVYFKRKKNILTASSER